ncbi:MAG: winged helix-turn-helix transcriptional regulator [Candidatus Nanoarchaeia archaeon]|nr:winged helix-turn-helix transcriptional regulator [Candidatus Nanoarchaeia archaeon]MDD5239542.1 winged helix-turn-helix transcriptional regulator [Candidatus Nanoarchaeia archaeon]
MPKKGPDTQKIKKILETLKKNPNGIWVRELARKSDLDKSTVSRYITEYLNKEVEEIYDVGGLIKLVKLK